MGELLLLLGELLANAARQLGLAIATSIGVEYVTGLLKGTQGGSSWVQLSNEVGTIESEVENGTYGLNALAALIAAARTDILAAIANTQQAGSPVTLPATTPSGGAWLDAGNAGDTVWHYTEILGDTEPYQHLQSAGSWTNFLEVDGVGPQIDWLVYASSYSPVFDNAWTVSYPSDDPSTILAGDTLLSWLTRENPGAVVSWYGGTGAQVAIHMGTGDDIQDFLTSIIDADFQIIKRELFPLPAISGAPVWPGLANVTLGTPVALADGLELDGPLAGVIIDITGVAPPVSFYPFGSLKSYVRAGALLFLSDNGDAEFPQPFGPQSEVVLPKAMITAGSAILRVTSGVTGTATPFTIP